RGVRRAWPPLRERTAGVASVARLVLGTFGQALVRDRVFELAHARAEGAPDLWHALGAEEQQRDQEQERQVGGVGQADQQSSSFIEMSVTVAPATATPRRIG